jgi:predicted dinucleotide-binding enzyme
VDAVSEVIERIGYDAVRLDQLRAGRVLEPGGPVFGISLGRAEFEEAVRAETKSPSPPLQPLPTTLQTGDLT